MLCFLCCPFASCQDLCQALEALNSAVTTVSASAQKVANRGTSSVQEAAALQQRYEETRSRAKERQAVLENLLAHWQR